MTFTPDKKIFSENNEIIFQLHEPHRRPSENVF